MNVCCFPSEFAVCVLFLDYCSTTIMDYNVLLLLITEYFCSYLFLFVYYIVFFSFSNAEILAIYTSYYGMIGLLEALSLVMVDTFSFHLLGYSFDDGVPYTTYGRNRTMNVDFSINYQPLLITQYNAQRNSSDFRYLLRLFS